MFLLYFFAGLDKWLATGSIIYYFASAPCFCLNPTPVEVQIFPDYPLTLKTNPSRFYATDPNLTAKIKQRTCTVTSQRLFLNLYSKYDANQNTTSKDQFKFQLHRLRECEQISSKMHSMGWFKKFGVKQIHGCPLSIIHVIFRGASLWFKF